MLQCLWFRFQRQLLKSRCSMALRGTDLQTQNATTIHQTQYPPPRHLLAAFLYMIHDNDTTFSCVLYSLRHLPKKRKRTTVVAEERVRLLTFSRSEVSYWFAMYFCRYYRTYGAKRDFLTSPIKSMGRGRLRNLN